MNEIQFFSDSFIKRLYARRMVEYHVVEEKAVVRREGKVFNDSTK